LKRTLVSDSYYHAHHSMVLQVSNLKSAQDALNTHLECSRPRSGESHLRSSALANLMQAEEEKYQEQFQQSMHATRDFIFELLDAEEKIGSVVEVELENGGHYRVLFVSQNRLIYI